MNGNEMLDILGKIDPKLVKQSQKPPVIRWVALVACLVLIIGITAMLLHPGASPTPTDPVLQAPTESSTPTEPTTPTNSPTEPDSEKLIAQRLSIYWEIWRSLEFYKSNNYGYFSFRGIFVNGVPNGNEGLKYCYDFLSSMEDLKPYLNEETFRSYVGGYSLPKATPEELLARFTIIEDVPLSLNYTKYDPTFGNQNYYNQVLWRYNTDGNLVHLDQTNYVPLNTFRLPQHQYYNYITHCELFFQYDESGTLIYPWFGENRAAETPIIPTYNENGQLIRENGGHHTLLYSYNEQGHLSQVLNVWTKSLADGQDLSVSNRWDFTYQYDDNGNITQCITQQFRGANRLDYTYTDNYTYDSQNRVCRIDQNLDCWGVSESVPFIERTQQKVLTYTYDEQGRLLTESAELVGGTDANGQPVSGHFIDQKTYVYGDHYIFDEYTVEFPS